MVDRALAGGPVRRERGLRARVRDLAEHRPAPVPLGLAGALLAVVLWIVLSIAFGVYIQHFSTYGAAYGAFGAAIVLLLWLYLSANAFLFGGEFNAELERAERIGDGAPPAASHRRPRSRRAARAANARGGRPAGERVTRRASPRAGG